MHQPERRQFLRVEADLAATCTPIGDDDARGEPYAARTVDLSAGGARLTTADALPDVGTRLWLELTFARPRFLVFCEAEVVRIAGDRAFAVRFLALDEYIQQRVVRWVYAQDRRLFSRHAMARIPLRIRVVCRRLAAESPVEEFTAPSVDLSGDSIRVRSDRVLPQGTPLELSLELGDGGPPFAVRAVVDDGVPAEDGRTVYTLRFDRLGVADERALLVRALRVEREQRP